MTDTTKTHEAIRKALAVGPTPGPWTASNRGSYGVSDGDEGSVYGPDGDDIGAEFVNPIGNMPTIRGELWHRDAVFVAACDPEAIAALLADLDRLAAEVERRQFTEQQRVDLLAAAFYIAARGDPSSTLNSENAERTVELLMALSGFDIDAATAAIDAQVAAPPSPGKPS